MKPLSLGSLTLALALATAACSGSSSDTTSGDGGLPAPPPSGSSGDVAPTGACRGLVACGSECTVLDEDAKHCGACDAACPGGSACVNGTCRAEGCAALFRLECGTQCVRTDDNPDHCGACDVRCGAKKTCHKGACVDVFGGGGSCADPILMPGGGDNVNVAFSFDGATETQLLTCGEPTARPRKVFRFTANKTKAGARFELRGGLPTNDLVLEVFADASCDKASALACNDDAKSGDLRPAVEVDIETGKTYFVVASSKGPPPSGRFYARFDD